MKNIEKIEGKHIYLRPITEADTDDVVRWRNSEAVRPFFIYQKPFTKEGHLNWLKEVIFAGKGYQFIICLKENDRPIGSAFLRDYDPVMRKAEYGIFLGGEVERGKGIGTESLLLTLKFAFGELGLHKVFSRILSDNLVSINHCLNGGFEREGYLKDEVWLNGEYKDVVLVAIINPGER